jgi:NADPH:quinone reductase-like Zn-dependent oxidoreductase
MKKKVLESSFFRLLKTVFLHKLGSEPTADQAVFREQPWNSTAAVDLIQSEDYRYLAVVATSYTAAPKTEIYFKDLKSDAPLSPLVKGIDAVFLPFFAGDRMYLQTTWNAPNGRIVVVGNRGKTEIDARQAMGRDAAILGMTLFNVGDGDFVEIHAALISGLANGTLNPVVGREIPIADAARAHEAVMEPGALGKIVLLP